MAIGPTTTSCYPYWPTQYPATSVPSYTYTYVTPAPANDRCSAVCDRCGIQYQATAVNAETAEARVTDWIKAHRSRCPAGGDDSN